MTLCLLPKFPNGQIYLYFDMSNIRAHYIHAYMFGARELDISIYPWFAFNFH